MVLGLLTQTPLSGLGFILFRGPSDLDLVSVDWELIFESQVHIARVFIALQHCKIGTSWEKSGKFSCPRG